MKHRLLYVYQIGVACSDTLTGASLMIAPSFTLRLLGITAPAAVLVYIAYIGAFVLGVGLCCTYGALVLVFGRNRMRLEMVWLLTAILRSAIAVFVAQNVLSGALAPPWIGIALFDGLCALLQGIGLKQEWLHDGAR